MKKKLYVVRHGQTLFNQKKRIQGWCDSPLTDLGHEQAKRTKEYFEKKGIHLDTAACSTLSRTEQTLKEITDLPYERLDDLKEFHYGTLEGESTDLACGPKHDLNTYYVQFGGETPSKVADRMERGLRHLMEKEDSRNVLVVSHGSSSFRFANKVDPKRARKLRKFANCMIYEYDYDDQTGEFHLVDVIDEHVKDLQGIEVLVRQEEKKEEQEQEQNLQKGAAEAV